MLLDDDLKVQLETKLVGQVITSITSEQSRSIAGSRVIRRKLGQGLSEN